MSADPSPGAAEAQPPQPADPSLDAPPGATEAQPSQPADRLLDAPPGAAEASRHPKPAQQAEVLHPVKSVDFFGRRTPIVYQERNGPCPLFAICNLLLLKGVITLDDVGKVSQQKLISMVSECLNTVDVSQFEGMVEGNVHNLKERLNNLLPHLPGGMNLDMHLTKVDQFEFTPERALFHLLGIPIYHGFIVDPQDTETAAAIGSMSYDALRLGLAKFTSAREKQDELDRDELDRAIKLSLAGSGDGEVTAEMSQGQSSSTNMTIQSECEADFVEQSDKTKEVKWELIEAFVLTNLTQLTAYGVLCLHEKVQDGELCVLFYNNHYLTMYKHEGRLYMLENDESLILEHDLVWKRFDQVNGDGTYVTSKFTSWEKQEVIMSIDSVAYSDKTSGELLTFDASVMNTFIVNKDWDGLDGYLSKFIAKFLKKTKTPEEVVMIHPGLFMISRMENLFDMLSELRFAAAAAFFQKSIEIFRECHGRFIAFDLLRNINDLAPGVRKRYVPATRFSEEEIQNRILDYIHGYFPSAIPRYDGPGDGIWQFAIRLPKPDKQGSYYGFRCLLCGWVTKGSYSLSHLRSHFLQSSELRCCPKVTEDAFDRLLAIDGTKEMKSFEEVKAKFQSKRRSALSHIVKWVPPPGLNTSLAGPSTSGHGKGKMAKCDGSRSFDTPTSVSTRGDKRKTPSDTSLLDTSVSKLPLSPASFSGPVTKPPLLPLSPASGPVTKPPLLPSSPGSFSGPVTKSPKMMAMELSKATSAILDFTIPAVVPAGADRISITNAVVGPLNLAIREFRTYALGEANPAQQSIIARKLEEAADSVYRLITAAVIPDNEYKSYLLGRVAAIIQTSLEISLM